jgi:hypothetical protein
MTRGGVPLWYWIGLLVVVAATVGLAMVAFRSTPGDSRGAEEVGALIAVTTAGTSVTGWLWRLAQRTGAPPLPLQRAADELAEQLRRQWDRVAAEQRLTRPAPIPVAWRWSSRPVTSPVAEAIGDSGGRWFAPLPGMAAVTAAQLHSGTLKDLLGVYGGLGSGRLIVLGEPGAGESSAGILLLRDALAHRATVRKRDRARVPVPVLVSAQGWDPAEPFPQWLAARLARDCPLLQAPEYGEDAAMRLIEDGWLAVILDGLDEIPEAQRPEALRELNKQTFRLVVLTHTKELMAAVSGGHLQGAAALELLPIEPEQAAQYLASCLIHPPPDEWHRVIDHLGKHRESPLAQALTTPLMLTLVRDTYRPGEPGEAIDKLIDDIQLPTREAVENHLMDRVLTTRYPLRPGQLSPPYTLGQVRRWLGQLAHRMNKDGTRDLAWWRIPRWVPAWPRACATVAVVGFVSLFFAFLVWSLAGPAAHIHLLPVLQAGPWTAAAVFFARGLGYASMFGFGLLLVSPYGAGSPPQREWLRWSRTDILMILLLGAGVGVGTGLQNGLLGAFKPGLAIGLVSSFVVGLGFALGGRPPQQLGWLRWSRTDTRTNPRTGLPVKLTVGLLAGLVAGLGYGYAYGLKPALWYGFVVGIGYLLVIIVGGRTSPQRGQLRWSRTSILTTILIGLIIAIVSTGGYGIIYVLLVLLSGRPVQQRGQFRWSRTTTPITLIGLAAGPLLWLWQRTIESNAGVPALGFNLALGLGFGLTAGLLVGSRPPMTATNPLDPQSLWRQEHHNGLVIGLVVGLVIGLVYGLKYWLVYGLADGLVGGFADGLVAGLGSMLVSSATWTAKLANTQLRRRDNAPEHLLGFLDDAHQRQILRTVGPVYQFQHTRIQDWLTKAYETTLGEAPETHVVAEDYSADRAEVQRNYG